MEQRRIIRKIFSLGIALIMSVSLAACGSQNAASNADGAQKSPDNGADKKFKVGVVIRDNKSPFQAAIKQGIETAAKEYPQVEFDIRDGQTDVSVQTNIIETFITQKKDLIIAIPAQLDALVPVVKKANAENIPVMTVNNQLGEGAEVLTYVGADDYKGGQVQGELVKDMLNGKGNIVLIQGVLGTSPQVLRQKGMEDYLKENAPDIKIIAAMNNDWDNAKSITVVQNFLTRFPKGQIDGIVVQGPYDAIAAADACKAAGRTELVGKVIGFDMPKEVLEAIGNGTLFGTVNQDPAVQGTLAVKTASDYLSGKIKKEDIEPETWTDLPKVNNSNYKDFKASW